MSAPRIVLHLGAPKTGSTYIQMRLAANRERLRERGFFLPVLPEVAVMTDNAKLLAMVLEGEPTPSFRRAFPHIDIAATEASEVAGRLTRDWRRESETLLLSAENLRPAHVEKLRRLFPAAAQYRPILFIRRQDQWANSYFNQLTKTGDIHESIQRFVERLCARAPERLFRPDWLAHVEAWEQALGSCEVVCFDEMRERLFEAYAEAAGLPWEGLVEIAPQRESIDIFQLAYLLGAPTASQVEFARRSRAGAAVSQRRGLGGRRPSLLGPAQTAALRERFAPDNARLLQRLGRAADAGLLAIEPRQGIDLDAFMATAEFIAFRREADVLAGAEPAA